MVSAKRRDERQRSPPKTRTNPTSRVSAKLASLMGSSVVGLHQGPRTYAPLKEAGHMTAADQIVRSVKKCLPSGAVHIGTTGDWIHSPPTSVAIFLRSSTTAISGDQPLSPARSRSITGVRSSPIPQSPTPFSTVSSTMHTASTSGETACERSPPKPPVLTSKRNPDPNHHAGNGARSPSSEKVAAFDRNAWPRSIGLPGRNRRNA